MRARKTRLITELEQEKQRLEMEVRNMQKLKETKVTTKGNIILVIMYCLTIRMLFRYIITKRFRASASLYVTTRSKCTQSGTQ